ncbi:MAG: tRNA (cytidine(56)-2'-O)-methyltransferase [Halolamina sp.]
MHERVPVAGEGGPEVAVLRLGHRPGRDDRMTTHVGLTARALGADRVSFPDNAGGPAETVRDITDRFGGPFDVELDSSQKAAIRGFEGTVVHLTMYGERVEAVVDDVRAESVAGGDPLLVVVGGEKVPFEVYDHADYNVAVTNQPHSEVAGLAVFLDRLFAGSEFDREWADANREVVPMATGKKVVEVDGDEADGGADPDDSNGRDGRDAAGAQ